MNTQVEPSQRQIRFSEVIRKIICDAFKKNYILNDEIDLGSITVSFVNVSKDLKFASVYVMPLGGYKKEETLVLLNENKFFFQKFISREKLKIKYIPKIKFYLDDTYEEAQKIQKLFLNKKVIRDLKK
jgi:ribosome-binding factor A